MSQTKKVVLGRSVIPNSAGKSYGQDVTIDVQRLLETRLLVQANSSGGKSKTLRRIIEQLANHVQIIVIDPEGEFSTVREKFDFIIAAPSQGDAVAHPKTAALLARRLLETGVSAIIDIYDLKKPERELFVKLFLDAMVNAPKSLWRPVFVVLDEAQDFAPEKDGAVSSGSVIDMAARGRKRGQCLCVATQRLSKLDKDVAGEMLNKVVGLATMDIDIKRAAFELGFSPRDAVKQLRDLDPGHFWCFGPAIGRVITRVHVGPVITTHPEVGQRLMTAPPAPSAKVRKILQALADLPQQAEQEARSLSEIQAELRQVRAELARKAKEPTAPDEAEIRRRIAVAIAQHQPPPLPVTVDQLNQVRLELGKAKEFLGDVSGMLARLQSALPRHAGMTAARPGSTTAAATPRPVPEVRRPPLAKPASTPASGSVTASQQRILDVLAQLGGYGLDPAPRETVAVFAGVSPTSSGYANNLGALRSAGLVDYPSQGMIGLSPQGRELASLPAAAATVEDLHSAWYRALTEPQATILKHLVEAHPAALSREQLAELAGVSPTSSGYANNLGRLRTLGAIDYPTRGQVVAHRILFPVLG